MNHSKTLLQNNILILSQKSPILSTLLSQVSKVGIAEKNKNGETSIQINGNFILNKLFPKAEAQKRIEAIVSQNNTFICVIGLAPLYHIECIREKFFGKIVVYEPHAPLLKTVAEVHDLSKVLSDQKIFIAANFDELSKIMRHQFKERDVVGVYGLPFYVQHFPKECTQLTQFLDDEIKAIRSSILVKKEHSKHHTTHFLRNIPYISTFPNIEILNGIAKNFPAVVVGAGPSLSKAISFLHEYQKSLFIICVDVAARSLMKHHIEPHIICTLEQNDISWRTLQNLDLKNVYLAIGESANPNNFSIPCKGKFIILQENHDFIPDFAKAVSQSTIESCATVTSAAFQIARLTSGNPIILCGQDLGFTGNEVYHKDTNFRETEVVEKKVDELRKRNPLSLTYKERVLLDPLEASFLTEEDRVFRFQFYDYCQSKKIQIPSLIEQIENNHLSYKEFLLACENYQIDYHHFLFTQAEVHYCNSIHSKQRVQKPTVRILDVHGQYIATNISYKTTALWLGQQAKKMKSDETNRKCYNISDGAMIEGFDVIHPEQAHTIMCQTEHNILQKLENLQIPKLHDISFIMAWVQGKKKDVQKIITLCQQGIQTTQKLSTLWQKNSPEKSHLIESFNRIHQELNLVFNKGILWNYYFSAEIQNFDQEKENTLSQSKEILFVYQKLYEAIKKEIKTIDAEFEKILIP